MRYLIAVILTVLLLSCAKKNADAQTPYYTRLDSVGAAAVTGAGDSLATFTMGRLVTSLSITITNATIGDTLKARALWYGNGGANWKTVSWRNTKNGSIDSILYIAATSGLPQTWELLDPNIDNLQIYSAAPTYLATRKSKVYFRYRK